ncbi:MAG TPA: hypothetical protein VFI44_00435, partial [Ornithinibacter sp.]|nr:hypothetical protein [Ornithinibacter sp.]
DPVGLQRLVRGVQDLGVVASPAPTVVVNKVRAGVAGPRPERAIAEVLGRFAGLEQVRFVPWAPDDCDTALLAGKALTEVAPQSPVTTALADLASALDPRAAASSRAGRRGGRRRRRTPLAAGSR